MFSISSINNIKEKGMTAIIVAISMFLLLAMAGYSIDIERTLYAKRSIQEDADMASIGAVAKLLEPGVDDTLVYDTAEEVAVENAATPYEINLVECGEWDSSVESYTACGHPGVTVCTDCSDPDANAVRVQMNRTTGMSFARILNTNSLNTMVSSIATIDRGEGGDNCVRPIGVEESVLNQRVPGDTFSVGRQSNGNWLKLDVGGNMSSGNNFSDAMMNGICHSDAAIGNEYSQGTGHGGSIGRIFSDLVNAGLNYGLVIPTTTLFGNGNSNVTLTSFIKVDYLYDNGRSGANWAGTFRLIENPTTPPTGGGAGTGTNKISLVQ